MQIKILVADDSAPDRLIIQNMLSDYHILTACDGVETMRMLEEHDDINMLILDLKMPNMDGFEVLEALKGNERFRKLRTIVLTNYDELENEIKGLKLGAVDFIRKPIHMDSLRVRIEVHAALLRAQEALERQLAEQKLSFDRVFEEAPIGITISRGGDEEHPEGVLLRGNPAYEQITGRTTEELRRLGWPKITHPDDLKGDLEQLSRLYAGEIKSYSMEKRYIKPDGSIVWVHIVCAALSPTDDNTVNYISFIQDISDRKKIENEFRYIYEHDGRTGLYNRNYLEALLSADAKLKKGLKRALIDIDLSTVQLLVANYGFQYTQNLIKRVAQALARYCTESRILFQPRENRFVFYIVDYKDKDELIAFSNTIADTLMSVLVTERIGGGIGIVEIEQGGDEADIDMLLRRLMIASERSLSLFERGFRTCFYDDQLEALVNRERDVVEALNAIAEHDYSRDDLFLQYQPIIDLKTGSILSFEALARLRTGKLGLVPPMEFIPIAEKTKLIIPIGERVIVKALQFLNRLKELGRDDVNVSINISAIQLLNPGCADRLLELIRKMQVAPKNIGIEITESVFAADFEHINSILQELRDAGISVAIDDFGTGYPSLAREKELKVDCIKIAKQFIDRLLVTERNRTITGDIISMSHRLGHRVVAEGVEHDVQLKYLKDHNCDMVQGYLISVPLDEDDAIRFLERRR